MTLVDPSLWRPPRLASSEDPVPFWRTPAPPLQCLAGTTVLLMQATFPRIVPPSAVAPLFSPCPFPSKSSQSERMNIACLCSPPAARRRLCFPVPRRRKRSDRGRPSHRINQRFHSSHTLSTDGICVFAVQLTAGRLHAGPDRNRMLPPVRGGWTDAAGV